MAVPFASTEPLPTGIYTGTMSSADIYPSHVGIGGIRTQDRALPAYAESMAQAQAAAANVGSIAGGLFSTPAGWLFVLVLVLFVFLPWIGERG